MGCPVKRHLPPNSGHSPTHHSVAPTPSRFQPLPSRSFPNRPHHSLPQLLQAGVRCGSAPLAEHSLILAEREGWPKVHLPPARHAPVQETWGTRKRTIDDHPGSWSPRPGTELGVAGTAARGCVRRLWPLRPDTTENRSNLPHKRPQRPEWPRVFNANPPRSIRPPPISTSTSPPTLERNFDPTPNHPTNARTPRAHSPTAATLPYPTLPRRRFEARRIPSPELSGALPAKRRSAREAHPTPDGRYAVRRSNGTCTWMPEAPSIAPSSSGRSGAGEMELPTPG